MSELTRRECLTSMAVAGVGAACALSRIGRAAAAETTTLSVERRTLEVKGRAASVYGIMRPGGGQGTVLEPGERFTAELVNRIARPTLIHWHGQSPPNAQDGVPGVTQPALEPGGRYRYDFEPRPGTHWMHSHLRLQEQQLMAAPMIARTPEDVRADMQEAVLLLHDFTFRDPEEILAGLKSGHHRQHAKQTAEPARQHESSHLKDSSRHAMQGGASGGGPSMNMDLNDIEFDAFLANDRTLDDPEVVRVDAGGRLRLRIINGASSTNFFIDTGALDVTVVAMDGAPIVPVSARRIPLTMAQRVDLVIQVPNKGGAWPIMALREGTRERTGVVLATKGGHVHRLPAMGEHAAGALGVDFEARLEAARPPPPRAANLTTELTLTGDMASYAWGIDGKAWGAHDPVSPKLGDRVHLTFRNRTMMAHPMHLHGHQFQIIAINGRAMAGAVRDTVLVPANGGTVTIAFDADNPGRWVMHCHNLYHMLGGMMTEVRYGA